MLIQSSAAVSALVEKGDCIVFLLNRGIVTDIMPGARMVCSTLHQGQVAQEHLVCCQGLL